MRAMQNKHDMDLWREIRYGQSLLIVYIGGAAYH